MSRYTTVILSVFVAMFVLIGCNAQDVTKQGETKPKKTQNETQQKEPQQKEPQQKGNQANAEKPADQNKQEPTTPPKKNEDAIQVVANPDSVEVLVNKQHKLPDGYAPKDLVDVKVPYAKSATAEKRKLRQAAATALENLFAGAKNQGISLLGVSGYRSNATQTFLFNSYVARDGYEKARTYSALPGTSEHETGLSIDVTGGDGSCAVDDCFADKPEAKWLAEHAAEYGYIIRYPKGKEAITGYKYEPWHIRFVGVTIAKEIKSRGITLEEYNNAIPVNN